MMLWRRSTGRLGVAVATLVALAALLGGPPAGAETDPAGDIDAASVDILEVEAGVLPPGHELTPTGTEGIAVWVRFRFASPWPPSDALFSWFASDSKFFPDPDRPGQTIHLSGFTQRHDGVSDTGSVCANDSSSCPARPFLVQAHPQTDGTLLIVQGIPYRPTSLGVRAAAGIQETSTGQRRIDQVPNSGVPIPVSLTPVDPLGGPTGPPADDRGDTTPREDAGHARRPVADVDDACWACWGLKALFALALVCALVHFVGRRPWWSWWLLWIVLALFWLPVLLAGLVFWAPGWWWAPLLGWFPVIAAGVWFWARHRPWWRPWMWLAVIGWAALVAAGLLAWEPRWWFLLPVLWVPWVLGTLCAWGWQQPWWRWWMWPVVGGFVAWVFVWVIWLTPGWAWVIPWLWAPVLLGGQLLAQGGWAREAWPAKLWFFCPWITFPWFAFQDLVWDPWWCFVVASWFLLFLLGGLWCFRAPAWWQWQGFWLLIVFAWIPLLIGGLVFWAPGWWWAPLLVWFPAIGALSWWWARRQAWWRPWMWSAVIGWAALIAVGLFAWSPSWWFLLPVLWIPWALGMLLWVVRQGHWPWWLLVAPLAAGAWVFAWLIWLNPGWWWLVALLVLPVLFVWWWGKAPWAAVCQKLCFVLPWALLPALVFGVVDLCYDFPVVT